MSILLRTIAIVVEVGILAIITYSVLFGVKLAIFDLGVNPRYQKAANMAFLFVGCVIVLFFIAHLTAWYPGF